MAHEPDNLVLELLRAIRADITDLKRESVDVAKQLASMGQQIGAMNQQLGALTIAFYTGKSEVSELKSRVGVSNAG